MPRCSSASSSAVGCDERRLRQASFHFGDRRFGRAHVTTMIGQEQPAALGPHSRARDHRGQQRHVGKGQQIPSRPVTQPGRERVALVQCHHGAAQAVGLPVVELLMRHPPAADLLDSVGQCFDGESRPANRLRSTAPRRATS